VTALGRRDGEVAQTAPEVEDVAFEMRQRPLLEGVQPVLGGVDLPVELIGEEVDRLVACLCRSIGHVLLRDSSLRQRSLPPCLQLQTSKAARCV
jgi:hypothetical protein